MGNTTFNTPHTTHDFQLYQPTVLNKQPTAFKPFQHTTNNQQLTVFNPFPPTTHNKPPTVLALKKPAFENLHVYQLADQLSDLAWDLIQQWKYFEKDTIGKQLVRAADSVGANIAEGSGRGTSKENSRFAKIARGSLFEVKHWLRRARKQELLSELEMNQFQETFNTLAPKLSAYINFLSKKH